MHPTQVTTTKTRYDIHAHRRHLLKYYALMQFVTRYTGILGLALQTAGKNTEAPNRGTTAYNTPPQQHGTGGTLPTDKKIDTNHFKFTLLLVLKAISPSLPGMTAVPIAASNSVKQLAIKSPKTVLHTRIHAGSCWWLHLHQCYSKSTAVGMDTEFTNKHHVLHVPPPGHLTEYALAQQETNKCGTTRGLIGQTGQTDHGMDPKTMASRPASTDSQTGV